MLLEIHSPLTIDPTGALGRKLGELWKGLSDTERKPYEDKAATDKKRYEDEKATYALVSIVHPVSY